MRLCLLLLPLAAPGYERQVLQLAQATEEILGDAAFEGVGAEDVADIMVRALESPTIGRGEKLQLAVSVRSLSWWCGLTLSMPAYARIGVFVRETFEDETRGLIGERPVQADHPVHNLFVGDLVSPLHSPSRGAADYARALAGLPQVRHLNIHHAGPVPPIMLDHLREALAGSRVTVDLQSVHDKDFLADLRKAGGVNHVWCDDPMALHLTAAARLGPTLMFTCGDVPPFQHADVYWFFRDADYIAASWRRFGVPEPMIADYVACAAGPNDDRLRPARRLPKAALGLREDEVVLATVGTRLAVDLDKRFVDGIEATLRMHSNAHWLVVGSLPDYLRDACRSVFGRRFSHRPFEPDLPALMTAVDLFVNPFRAGGGDSAMRAMTGGAVVVTRGDLGDVGALTPPEHRRPDADAFFATLSDLVADAPLRASWAARQSAHAAGLADQTRFAAELQAMIGHACLRWNRRRGPATDDVSSNVKAADAA